MARLGAAADHCFACVFAYSTLLCCVPLWVLLQVLSAYIQMASKARGDIEAAVGQLLDLANTDANNVPVLMGLAHGFLLLKQTAKARNQLKVRSRSGLYCAQIVSACCQADVSNHTHTRPACSLVFLCAPSRLP